MFLRSFDNEQILKMETLKISHSLATMITGTRNTVSVWKSVFHFQKLINADIYAKTI